MANFLFRVDASDRVALGHLKRSVALSVALQNLGHKIFFVTLDDIASKKILSNEKVFWVESEVAGNGDADCLISYANHLLADVVLVDSHQINASYLDALSNHKFRLLVFDDFNNEDLPVDGVIHFLPSDSALHSHADLLMLGFEYVVLGPEYWDPHPKHAAVKVERILITLGGIDHYGLTEWLISTVSQLAIEKSCNFILDVVIGPYFENISSIEASVKLSALPINLHISPNGLRELFRVADIVLTAGGGAVFESVRLGIPTVGIGLSDQQNKTVNALDLRGAIVGDYYSSKDELPLLKEKISYLISNYEKRYSLSKIGPLIIDGQGAKKIAQQLTSAFNLGI